MKSLYSICATVLLVGLSFTTVSCIQCHNCTTYDVTQDDCETIAEGSTKYLVDCKEGHNESCMIQEQWVGIKVLNQTHGKRTIRQCASTPFDPDRACYYRASSGVKLRVCNCIGDGCNEASRTMPTLLMTLVLFFIVKYLSHSGISHQNKTLY